MRNCLLRALAACAVTLLISCGGGGNPAGEPADARANEKAAASGFGGNGTYWNPFEPGTGFVFEAQGDTGVVTFFVFDTKGKPVWYTASGPFSTAGSGFSFSGTLLRYSGGQPATSSVPKTPTSAAVGSVQISFNGDAARVELPGRVFAAQRFNPSSQGTPATATQPQTGIYWNPAESGRGYTIEVRSGIAMIGVFHYDEEGSPTWNLVVGDIASGTLAADFNAYSGGQTLTGTFVATKGPASAGQFRAAFNHACQGTIQFPGKAAIAVEHFVFGAACTTPQPPPVFNTGIANCPDYATPFDGQQPRTGTFVLLESAARAAMVIYPPKGAFDLHLCLFSMAYAQPTTIPPVLAERFTDPMTELQAGVFADRPLDQGNGFSLRISRQQGVSQPYDHLHVTAYTQNAQGIWEREVLNTTRYVIYPPAGTPIVTVSVVYVANITKPGFFGLEKIQ